MTFLCLCAIAHNRLLFLVAISIAIRVESIASSAYFMCKYFGRGKNELRSLDHVNWQCRKGAWRARHCQTLLGGVPIQQMPPLQYQTTRDKALPLVDTTWFPLALPEKKFAFCCFVHQKITCCLKTAGRSSFTSEEVFFYKRHVAYVTV